MDNPNEPLDRLISETLNSIHGRALQDPLANTHHTLENVGGTNSIHRLKVRTKRHRSHSFLAVAASIALIVGIGLPVLNSSQSTPGSDSSKRIQSTDKMPTTSSALQDPKTNITTTSNPLIVDPGNVTTTSPSNSPSQNTTPFFASPSPSPSTTTPANVFQYARISYSNTRANSVPLDGATISGNVYIFYDDPNINSVHWWLDQPGVWDKTLATRSGQKQPQDFNYRVQPEAVVPNPYDTSALSVGEHTMGIQTRSITNQYQKITIKFYVAR